VGEAVPASALDELHDSAPPLDFVRPPQPSGSRHSHAVPSGIGLVTPPHLLAAMTVLLARHTRRSSVALAWDDSNGRRRIALAAPADTTFRDLFDAARDAAADISRPALDRFEPVPGVMLRFVDGRHDVAGKACDLLVRCCSDSDGVRIELDADADLYRSSRIEALARQLGHALSTVGCDSDIAPGDIDFMAAAERHRVLRGFNALRLEFPQGETLATLIQAQAERQPKAICAVHGDLALSFRDLNRRSTRLAGLLQEIGIGPGRFVALVDRRGLDFVIAMFAIWKAGGAYIPIDPGYPADRVRYMLTDSEATAAIVGRDALGNCEPALQACTSLRHVICLQPGAMPNGRPTFRMHGPDSVATQPAEPVGAGARATDPAYMVYTSGSTGRPKGAIVRHDGAVNHLFAQAHALGADAVSRFLQSAPSSSDISVWQFAAPLAFGGTTVIANDAADVANLIEQVQRHGLHVIELVPVVMRYFIAYAAALTPAARELPTLRWAMVTGESASVELVNAWLALYPKVPVINAYGPTEASDDIAQAVIGTPLPPRQATVPIGRPLANLDLYVLDERLRPLPVGAPGEICVAGVGVGDGYWKQPEKTQAAFVPNPFPDGAGPVIYRTGDLGRWQDDGTLECLGRLDHQVQLRGYRIELAEIEAVLRNHAGVGDVVVQAFHDGRGDGQLVAFVVAQAADSLDDSALRAHLGDRLPAHMVPTAYVWMTALPLNPAGKVDRLALRPPQRAQPGPKQPGTAPRTPLESMLAELWSQELGVPGVRRDDDFFALGGDSLAALAIVVAARRAGWRLRSADVLDHPTVAQLAGVARRVAHRPAPQDRAAGDVPHAVHPLPPGERTRFLAGAPEFEDVQALTPPQQGIYVHWLLARAKTAYVDQYVHTLEGALDTEAFEKAWNHVVGRHPALRTAFLRSALSQPVQAVCHDAALTIDLLDLSTVDEAAQATLWRERLADEIARGFDLAKPPLMRLLLARHGVQRHTLAWTHHHLVLDGWSMSMVLGEVLQAYACLASGRKPALPPAASAAPYLEALVTEDLRPGLAYWCEALSGVGVAPAWTTAVPHGAPPGFDETDISLPESATTALMTQAAGHRVTLTTLLQAAWAVLLARLTGRCDTVFGVVTSGRELDVPLIHRMVGLFVTTLPLRVDAAVRQPLAEWLPELQRRAAAARSHEAVPLAQIVRGCGLPSGQPLFETLFVMSNFPALDVPPSSPLLLHPAGFRTVPAYPLSLVVVPGPALHLRLVNDRQRLDSETIADIAHLLHDLISRLALGEDPREPA
jgi:amino acid adenylation domain-containing protein